VRVLFLAHAFPRYPGDPAGSFLHRLARTLQDGGAAVRVVAPGGPGLADEEEIAGVGVSRYRYAPRTLETLAYTGEMADAVRGSWGARLALAGLLAAAAARTRREAVRWSADLVHAHWWFPGGASAALPGAAAGRPVVLTLHGSDVRLARTRAPARAAYARVAGRAAKVTAVSTWLCTEALAMAPSVPCTVARMPVAAELFGPPPSASAREGVLFVGRLTAQKGVDVLLRAVAARAHSCPVTIVGAGPEEAALRTLSAELGIDARVRWAGAQPQAALAAFYRAARVLAVPSTDEGLGLVAVEAALCGTPAVGFNSGGLPDVIADGETGRLVRAGDADAFGRALLEVTASPGLADAYGHAAIARAVEFTPSAAAARYLDVYGAALARRGPRAT
jgi:glycosyltransferase involved in cell wall biosynthesis